MAIATNTYLLMYPRPILANMISTDPDIADSLFAALRNISPNEMREHARVYAGEMFKIEPKDLANVRIQLPENLTAANPQQELPFRKAQ